jgi:hypothetical protein
VETFSSEDIAQQIDLVRDLMNRLAGGSNDPADHAMLAAAVAYTLGAMGHLTDRLDDIQSRLVQASVKLWAPDPTPPAPHPLPLAEKG